ncbi:MAG: helicase HerA-like domain-containing protein [Pseudomonadota bacterium]
MAKRASKSASKKSATVSAEADATAEIAAASRTDTKTSQSAKPAKSKPAASPPPPAKSAEPLEPEGTIFVGQSVKPERILLRMANRHGLATGATGTGKTVTLQVLAEGFSRAGVPVFAADIKGDLSGIAVMGEAKPFLVERAQSMGLEFQPDYSPTIFWDLFGEQGHPIRATVSEMGPLLLARLLDLNDVQEGALNIAFRIADDQGLALLDFKDLRAILDAIAPFATKKEAEEGTGNPQLDEIKRAVASYGNVTKQTVGTIQRALLVLENQGGEKFFGEPALDLRDFMKTDRDGRGYVNILAADKLMANPRLYATFLLWLLSELFEELPEVGDPDKPKLVFFFDEAHLLFDEAPKALLDKIEQVVRLVRSKGVGVYFVTQNPLDVPDKVLAQLGNRVQHALRAFTPRDQKAVQTAATTFRANPKLDTAKVIMELGKGEALVSFLEEKGTPSMVERCMIRPPSGRMGPITPAERAAIMAKSPVKGKYDTTIDSESAYEKLSQRVAKEAAPAGQQEESGGITGWIGSIFGTNRKRGEPLTTGQQVARSVARTVTTTVVGGVAAAIGKQIGGRTGASVGRSIVRGTLGGILRR